MGTGIQSYRYELLDFSYIDPKGSCFFFHVQTSKEGELVGGAHYTSPGKERNGSQHRVSAEYVKSCELHYEFMNQNVHFLAYYFTEVGLHANTADLKSRLLFLFGKEYG